MYTAVIVDDEELGSETLKIMIGKFCPDVSILGIANDVSEGIEMIYELNPKIVFLDIDLPSGTGFDILSKTSTILKEVIFTTAHAEHAIKAIKENACDYILKPILVPDLVEAVTKAKKKVDELENITTKNRNSTKISIPSSDGIHLFNTNEIIRVEANSNYSILYFSSGKQIVSTKTLKLIEGQLPNHFIRVHSSHLVNIDFIIKYIKGDGGFVKLTTEDLIPVSRSYKEQLLKSIL